MTSSPCRAVLTPTEDGEYSVSFELSNPTTRPIALDTFEPFLQLQLRAAAGRAALTVEQPMLDIGLTPKAITVPASGKIAIATPLRLRLHASGPPSRDGFVWSINHAPRGVALTFTLQLPPPFDQPFTEHL
jgi:hypothetical protein